MSKCEMILSAGQESEHDCGADAYWLVEDVPACHQCAAICILKWLTVKPNSDVASNMVAKYNLAGTDPYHASNDGNVAALLQWGYLSDDLIELFTPTKQT